MDKSKEKQYQYDSYQNQVKNTNKSTSTTPEVPPTDTCVCCGPGSGKENSCVQGLFSNLGICALLLGYTLLGSFVFLAIEGGSNAHQRSNLFTGSAGTPVDKLQNNRTIWLKKMGDESRAKTVENIWDITVSLNILYRDNWTRLAAQEITRFQEQLVERITEEMAMEKGQSLVGHLKGAAPDAEVATQQHQLQAVDKKDAQLVTSYGQTAQLQAHRPQTNEWNFARAFLYSLTVLTTIGYGNNGPRTALGKAVTMAYAILGIPLMLVYLSSVGSLLSKCMRSIFTRTLCCCFCSNCGYCCYDEKQMQEKERRMRKKRQQMELQQQQQQLQEPFYVRSASSNFTSASSTHNNLHSPMRDEQGGGMKHNQSASSLDEMVLKSPGHILAPIILCLIVMAVYILLGAFVLTRLEAWPFLDGSYFCFMSLSTIGFGDIITNREHVPGNGTIWFCSMYILSGMALTAMCFNILHDEIVHRLRHRAEQQHCSRQDVT